MTNRFLRAFLVLSFFARTSALHAASPGTESKFEFVPQVSILSPSTFELTGDAYRVPYSSKLHGIPTVHAGVSLPLGMSGPFEFSSILKLGYGFKSGVFSVLPNVGSPSEQTIRLHSIPISLSAKVLYPIPGFAGLKIGFVGGAGMQFIFQNGDLDGLNQTFFFPCLFMGPTLSFIDNSDDDGYWFRGFTFGVTFQNSLGNAQVLRGVSFDLGANVRL